MDAKPTVFISITSNAAKRTFLQRINASIVVVFFLNPMTKVDETFFFLQWIECGLVSESLYKIESDYFFQ